MNTLNSSTNHITRKVCINSFNTIMYHNKDPYIRSKKLRALFYVCILKVVKQFSTIMLIILEILSCHYGNKIFLSANNGT